MEIHTSARSCCQRQIRNCQAALKGRLHFNKHARSFNCYVVFLQHGADPSKKNRDGATPLDLVREGDQDVADLLRGNAALLDAAKKGNLVRVQRLVTTDNINCRDAQGRNSTPLHLAGEANVNFFLQGSIYFLL